MGVVKTYLKGRYSQINFDDGRNLMISVGNDEIQIKVPGIFNVLKKPLVEIKVLSGRLWGSELGEHYLQNLIVRGKEMKSSTEFLDYCKKVKETFENQDPFDEDYQLKFPKITKES